ncbi:MAG: hypothetical protein ACRC92_11375 [Peptostreptococcaceae bacterium]
MDVIELFDIIDKRDVDRARNVTMMELETVPPFVRQQIVVRDEEFAIKHLPISPEVVKRRLFVDIYEPFGCQLVFDEQLIETLREQCGTIRPDNLKRAFEDSMFLQDFIETTLIGTTNPQDVYDELKEIFTKSETDMGIVETLIQNSTNIDHLNLK